jgi:phospho-N-acetylmuramoyl-pentapeptide-transferase
MIYHLLYPLSKYISVLNVTKYITFRGGCAFITSFLLVMLFWKFVIAWIKKLQFVERIDMYGYKPLESLYSEKKGTPTMGGVLILSSFILTTLLWARLDNYFIWVVILTASFLGALGLQDDLTKIKTGKGLTRRDKLFSQIFIGLILGFLITLNRNISTTWDFPFFKRVVVDLSYFYIFWVALVIVATSNAVNLTDGLDGLAIGGVLTNALIFTVFSYVAGNVKFSHYLFIPFVKGAGELSVVCLALMGAGLGFLWFNAHPAEIFMGDVGALSLGGVIGMIALFIKKEFLLIITGGLFVIETLSVILQILSVRLRGKKIFLAAPLHHHFQLMGWKESKVTVRFWIVSALFAVAALLTLKLR